MKRLTGSGLSMVLGASALLAPVAVAAPAAAVTPQVTVPNYFVRNCSYITSRCTRYRQTNPPYNPRVPSVYSTKWVWYWI